MNSDPTDSTNNIPSAVPRAQLKEAAEAILSGDHTFDSAAEAFKIDPDTLHRFYKQYVRAGGDDESEISHERRPVKEFQPIGDEERGNFSQNWEKAQEKSKDRPVRMTPLAESFSEKPILRRLVRDGEVSPRAVFEMAAIVAILALLAAFVPVLLKKPVETAPTAETEEPPTHDLPIEAGQQTIRRFLDAESADAIIPLVRNAEAVAPALREWFPAHHGTLSNYEYIFFEEQTHQMGKTFLNYTVIDDANSVPRPLAVECRGSGKDAVCLIDWEAFAIHQPGGDWDYFIDSRSQNEHVFRVDVQFSDYFNYGYTDQERYIALSISVPGSNRTLYLYLDRSQDLTAAIGNALIAQKPKGNFFHLTLKLTFSNTDPKEREVVRLVEMVSPTWLAP